MGRHPSEDRPQLWNRPASRNPSRRRTTNRRRSLAVEELETRITPAVLDPTIGGPVNYDAANGEDNRVVLARTQHFVTVDEAQSVFMLRELPAINEELIEGLEVGFSFVLEGSIRVGELLDLPGTRAIIPIIDLMNIPELSPINEYINEFVTSVIDLVAEQGLSLDIPAFPFEFTPGFGVVDFDIPGIDLTSLFGDFPAEFFANNGIFDRFLSFFATAVNPDSAVVNLGDRADTADLSGFDLPTTVNGGTGNDNVIGSLADDVFNGDEGDDTFIFNPEADGVTKIFNGGPGVDTLLLSLTDGNDDITLRQNGSDLEILFNGLTQTYRLIDVESIQIKGNAGNDNIIFDLSDGAVPVPLDIHAGDGEDRIVVQGDTAPTSNDIYIAKISSLSGRSEIRMGSTLQQMFFEQFDEQNEFFSDELPGSLNVHSTFLGSSIFVGASETLGFGVVSDGVDGPVRFNNKDALTIHGNSHGDEFVVDAAGLVPVGLGTLNLMGFSGDDSVLVLGSNGADNITYTATGGGEATIEFSGASLEVNLDAFEAVAIDALGGNDNLQVVTDNAVITLGGAPGTGTIESFAGSDALLAVEYADINNPVDVNGGGTAIVVGSEADDAFDVAGGLVTSFNPFGAANRVDVSGFAALVFDLGAGSDVVSIAQSGLFPGGIQVAGGEPGSGSDVVIAQGSAGTVLLDVGAGTLGGVVGGDITLGGVEELTVQGASSLQVNEYGLPTGLEQVVFDGGDSVAVNLTTGPDSVTFTPTGATSASIRRGVSDPVLELVNFNSSAGSVQVNGGGGPDTLTFVGTAGADTVGVSQASGQVDVTLQAGSVAWVPVRLEQIESLRVEGRDGSDRFNVQPGDVAVFVDGGTPVGATGDRLILTATTTAVYEPGPELDSGGFTIDSAQIVSFDNMEEFELNDVSGSDLVVTVKGTGGDDHLSAVGVGPGQVDLTVNNEKVLDYNGVAEVHIVGLNGTDDIDIDVNVASLGVEFFVFGGLPVNGDTLTLTGVDGAADNPVWTPGAADGGVFVLSGVTVNVAEIETLSYDGESDDETLEVQGQADADTFVHTPGSTVDAGNLATDSLLAVAYVHLGAGGTVTVAGLGGSDTLVAFGTSGVDVFALVFPGANQADLDLSDAAGLHVDLLTTSVESYVVRALEGDDRVGVQAPVNIDGSLALQGGEPDSGSDVFTVTLTGGAFDATVAPNLPTSDALVTGVGAPIPIDGFERIWFDNSGDPADDTLTVQTGVGDHVARVENAASGGDEVTSDFLPVVQFVNLDTFRFDDAGLGIDVVTFVTSTLDGAANYETDLGGRDTVIIEGNDSFNDSWRVSRAAAVPFAVTDQLSGVTVTDRSAAPISLRINGLNGDDAVTVDVDAAGGSGLIDVPITFDGGLGTDRLTIQGTPGTAVGEVIYTPGPALGAGRLDYQATPGGASRLMLIDFVGLEPVVDLVPSALLTVNGSNAANAITYRQGSVAGRGLVAVDGQETIEFSNKTTLALDGQGGNDTLTIEHPVIAPTGLTTVNVNGGAATGDAFDLRGSAGADTVSYTANAADGGQLVVNGTTYNVSLVEAASVNAVDPGAGDTLTVTTASATIIPGATPGTGTVKPVDLAGSALLALDYAGFESATVTGTTAVVQGTQANDIISILLSGIVEVTNLLGFVNSVNVAAFTTLVVNALGGDDTINIQSSGLFTGGITVVGGEPGAGSDLVTIVNDPNPTVNFNTNQVSWVVGGPITLSGIETLSVNGSDGALDAFTVLGYGMPTDVRTLNLSGGDTNNDDGDTIDITATASVDTLRYTSLSVSTARLERLEGGPVVNVSGFNSADDNLSLNAAGNIDELINVAPSSNDLTLVTQGGLGTRVTVTINGNPSGGVKWVPIDFTSVNALKLDGGAGNDRFDIDNSNGLVALTSGITVEGNDGSDTLRLLGQTAVTSSVYNVGPAAGAGTVTHTLGGATQTVFFNNLEPVIDLVVGPLVVNATNADNAINYTQGSVAANGLVSIDGHETIEFSNKITLTINGLAGGDTVNLNNPTNPTGLTAITVNGGDPTGSGDTVILNATAAVNFAYVAGSPDAANVTGAGPVPISVNTVEQAVLTVPGGGAFALTVTTPTGGQELTYQPGATLVDATITGRYSSLPSGHMLPLRLSNMSVGSTVTFADISGGRVDTLNLFGSSAGDRFEMQASGQVQVFQASLSSGIVTLPILTPGILSAGLFGSDGDDIFNVPGNQPIPVLSVDGGNPSASDVLNFTGSGGAVTVNLGAGMVQEAGFGVVSLAGVEVLNTDAATAALSLTGTAAPDTLRYTPTGATAGTVTLDGGNLTTNFTNVAGTFTLSGGAGSDNLVVNGTATAETIAVTGTQVTVGALETVDYSAVEALTVNGNQGSDIFNVTPSATVAILLDGGDPIGELPGDHINIAGPAVVNAGPENDDGSLSTAGNFAVSYKGIESITIDGGPAVVNGSDGDDAITVIARDASYDPLANGVRDFTVSVNTGPAVLYLNAPTLTINARGGSDTIAVQTPAPNGAVWDVDLTIDGGLPTGSDKVVFGTPGTDTVTYNPTGADSGTLDIVNLSSVTTLVQIEHLVFDGEGGNDNFTLVGTALTNTIVSTPGAAFDEGFLRVNNLLGITYQNLGGTATLAINGAGGSDTLTADGTANNDIFSVDAAGNVTLAGHLTLTRTNFESLGLHGLDGDDTFNIDGAAVFTGIVVEGGDPSASDVINLTGAAGVAESVTIQPSVANPTEQTIAGLGAPMTTSGVELIRYTGNGGDDSLNIRVSLDGGDVDARLEGSSNGFDRVQSDSLPDIDFTAVNQFTLHHSSGDAENHFTINTTALSGAAIYQTDMGGRDTLTIEGADGRDDNFRVFRPAVGLFAVTDIIVGVTITEIGNPSRLQIKGEGGDDRVTVDVAGTDLIDVPLTFDGGLGSDTLTVSGTPTAPVLTSTYTPGPALGVGRLVYVGGATMTVDFVNLEPAFDLVPAATLIVNGNDAANAITYAQGLGTNGRVSVDGHETLDFSGKGTLTVNGLGGADSFTVNHPATVPPALTAVNFIGGAGADEFFYRGATTNEAFAYTANAADGATLGVNGAMNYNLTAVERAGLDAVNAAGDNDTLDITTIHATVIPGETPGTGEVKPVDAAGRFLLPLTFVGMEDVDVTGTVGVIQGWDGNDTIRITAAGVVEVTDLFGFTNSFDVSAFMSLVVNALGGDDVITVERGALFPGTVGPARPGIRILGGDSGTGDIVTLFDPTGAAISPTIDFNTNRVTNIVAGPIDLGGVEVLNVNGTDGVLDAFTVLAYGAVTDVTRLNISGGDLTNNDGDTLDVTATASVDTLRYTSLSVSTARLERLEGGPVLNVTGFNNADNNLSLNGGGNVNELINVAPAGNDLTLVTQGGLGTRVTVTANGAAGGGVKWVPIDFAGVNALNVVAGAGNDRIDIDNTSGIVPLPAGINVDGGNGRDTLRLVGTTAVDLSRYTPGPELSQGTVVHTLGGAAQQVFFVNLEPVIDLVAGPLAIDGTNGDNAISYTAGPNSGVANVLNPAGLLTGQVTVDGFESYEFANKGTLTVNALAGSDFVNLNNPTTPTGLTGITVNGGDPTGTDSVIVNGTPAVNAIVVSALTLNGALVTGAQPVPVTVATSEHLTVRGLGGPDTLTVVTPVGRDTVVLTDGANADAGSLDIRSAAGAAYIPIDFFGVGNAGSLTIDSAGGREDELVVNATDAANLDAILTVSTAGTVALTSPAFPAPTRELVDVLTPGVSILRLNAFGGDDTFNVASNHPFADVVILGAEPDGNDTLNVTGGGAAQSVSLAAGTITETGFGAIHLTSIETVNLNATAANVSVTATATDDHIAVSPTTADALGLVLAGRNTLWNFSGVGATFSLDALAGSDELTVHDLQSGDTIVINGTTVSVTLPVALQPITHANFESLTVNGHDGNDTFDVTPAVGLPMFFAGGTAIGATAGDRIILRPAAGFTIEPGPENDAGGLNAVGSERVSWDEIEAVTIVGPGPGTLLGTNADDDITIIARDSIYDPGADGVQDFTVSVNDGPDILILDVATFNVDARSGDDSVVVRAPAAGAAGPWNVQLNLTGGEPAAGSLPQSDRFVLVTPGTTSVVYTPTPGFPDRGTFLIDQGGLNSLITLAPLPGSESGGFEFAQYDGEDGNDTLTLRTPVTADDVTTFEQTASDAGAFTFFAGGLNLLPLTVSDLGSTATINLTDAGGAGDRFIHRGTPENDTFAITTVLATSLTSDAGTPIVSTGVEFFTLNGAGGADTMTFLGDVGVENYTFNNVVGHVQMVRDLDAIDIEMTSVERAEVSLLGGADGVVLNNLGGTDLLDLVLDLGADAAQDFVLVEGSTAGDNLRVAATAGNVIVEGLSHTTTLRNPTTADSLVVRGNEGDDLLLSDAGATNLIRLRLEGGIGNDAIGGPGVLSGGAGNDVIDLSRITNAVQLDLDAVGAGQPVAGVGVVMLDYPGELFRGTPFTDTLWVRPMLVARSIDGVGGFDTINLDTFGSPALLTASTAFVSGFAPVSFTNVANINFVGDSIVNVSPLIRTLNVKPLKHNKRRNRWVMHILLRNFSDKLTLGGPFYLVLEKLPNGLTVLNRIGTAGRVSTTGGPVIRLNVLDDGKLGPGEVVGVEIEFRGTKRGLRALKQNAFSAVTYAGPGRI